MANLYHLSSSGMKITVFNGSHRGQNSNTDFMVREFLTGASEAGAETEQVFLIEKKVSPCRGCFYCWKKTPGHCVIKDDMDELMRKFISSDVAVFATPLYADNVSGITKMFMDRLIPILNPQFEKDENGESRHLKRYEKYPRLGVISNCGFPEQSHFQVLSLLFKRIARNIHSEVAAEIYRSEGEILRSKLVFLKPFIGKYQNLLRRAGREVAENSAIAEKTKKKLAKPLVPEFLYAQAANYYWEREAAAEKSGQR